MSNSWKDFQKLNTLSIGFANSVSKQATIFANGKNQVELLVTLSMQGTDGEPLEISQEELKEVLYLCDYRTGQEIKEPWTIVFEENEYNAAVSYQDVLSTGHASSSVEEQRGKLNVSFYVSCNTLRDNGLFAVGISIPGVGDFDTTEDGTGVPNGPGGETGGLFKSPKYVSIKLIPSINYSDLSNVEVKENDFQILTKNSERKDRPVSRYEPCNIFNDIDIKKKTVYIKPSNAIPNNRFIVHKATHPAINNNDVSYDETTFCDGSYQGFSALYPSDEQPSICSVIGRGEGREDFQMNFWFWEHDYLRLNGYFIIADNSGPSPQLMSRCSVKVDEKIEKIDGVAVLYLYKCIVPRSDNSKFYWRHVSHESKLYVTDIYGNEGTLTISFDDQDHFDVPFIR